MALALAIAAPASAEGRDRHHREATGIELYTLTPTCSSFLIPTDGPDCEIDENGIMSVPVENPGSRTGTFEGTQLFEGTIEVDTATLDFEYTGVLTFWGTVPSCSGDREGKVVFHNEGSGNFISGLALNHQETVRTGGTLPVSASLDLIAKDNAPNGDGLNDITGVYSCNKGHHGGYGGRR